MWFQLLADHRMGACQRSSAFTPSCALFSRTERAARGIAMTALAIARQLFTPPGGEAAETRHLLAQAAGAHAHLLHASAVAHEEDLDRLREVLSCYLHGPAPADEKRYVLDDPQLVEALHTMAP